MGKVLKKLSEIRKKPILELMARFKHIVGAKAVREYIASKPDPMLDIEIRLTEEELVSRATAKKRNVIKIRKGDGGPVPDFDNPELSL